MSAFTGTPRTTLTAVEEANLVTIVRATESSRDWDVTAEREVVRYFPTPAQEAALVTLLSAYSGDIKRAANTARKIDREDAEAVATEKFITLVRNENRTNERLAGFVSRAMVNAVMDADAEASAIRVPADTMRRYLGLVKEYGSLEAAYEVCKHTPNNFDPITLLAVKRAYDAESVEAIVERGSESDGGAVYGHTAQEMAHTATPGPEEAYVQADLVRWLFTLVPATREAILRLAYGFTDAPTEDARVKHGYPFDELLSDAQIGPVVTMSRAKVQRERTAALRTMADALQAIVDDES